MAQKMIITKSPTQQTGMASNRTMQGSLQDAISSWL